MVCWVALTFKIWHSGCTLSEPSYSLCFLNTLISLGTIYNKWLSIFIKFTIFRKEIKVFPYSALCALSSGSISQCSLFKSSLSLSLETLAMDFKLLSKVLTYTIRRSQNIKPQQLVTCQTKAITSTCTCYHTTNRYRDSRFIVLITQL